MKIIFLGTPSFATHVLEGLINSKHEVLAVVTQPDKPQKRSSKLIASPVKQVALNNNIKVFDFKRIKSQESIDKLKELKADIMVTCAYGQILSQAVLDITPLGVYNVHGSLLPKYRGAAPIQWAVINGEEVTGITIMKTDIGMDTGDMLLKEEMPILPEDTSGTVFEKMSKLGGPVLLKALDLIESGDFTLTPQNKEEASHFPMLKKEDGLINWNLPANEIVNKVRGFNPWPMAYTYFNGKRLRVLKAHTCGGSHEECIMKLARSKCGQVAVVNPKKGLLIKAKTGGVKLEVVQLEGKKPVSFVDFINGSNIKEGDLLGE